MRPIVISGLTLFLLAAPLNAQHAYYPLHVGNIWQYSQLFVGPDHWFVDVQETTILGDTVMPNGHSYAIVTGYLWSMAFLRQEGDSLLRWSPNGDVCQFDFARLPGDTIVSTAGQAFDSVFVITTARDTFMTFGARRCTWRFYLDNPNMIDEEHSVRVVDSIGITDVDYPTWGPWNFKAARVNGVIYGNLTSVEHPPNPLPSGFRLEQNFPNPFNPSTTIRYALSQRSHVTLTVFNTLGEQVARLVNSEVEAGYHEVRFDASNLSSGVYIYRLQAGAFVQTRKLCLIR